MDVHKTLPRRYGLHSMVTCVIFHVFFHHQTVWVICEWYTRGFQTWWPFALRQHYRPGWATLWETVVRLWTLVNLEGGFVTAPRIAPQGPFFSVVNYNEIMRYVCIYIYKFIQTSGPDLEKNTYSIIIMQGLPNTSIACCHVKVNPLWSNKFNKHLHHRAACFVSWQ